jgi:hypothetical protein
MKHCLNRKHDELRFSLHQNASYISFDADLSNGAHFGTNRLKDTEHAARNTFLEMRTGEHPDAATG